MPFKVIGTSTSEADALMKIKVLKPDLICWIYFCQTEMLKSPQTNPPGKYTDRRHFVTAAKDTCNIQETLRYGAVDYLIKPFDFERLQQALLNYLNLRQLISEHSDVSQDELDQYNYSMDVGG